MNFEIWYHFHVGKNTGRLPCILSTGSNTALNLLNVYVKMRLFGEYCQSTVRTQMYEKQP